MQNFGSFRVDAENTEKKKNREERGKATLHEYTVLENLVKIMTNDYSSLLTSLMTDSNEHIQWIYNEQECHCNKNYM